MTYGYSRAVTLASGEPVDVAVTERVPLTMTEVGEGQSGPKARKALWAEMIVPGDRVLTQFFGPSVCTVRSVTDYDNSGEMFVWVHQDGSAEGAHPTADLALVVDDLDHRPERLRWNGGE